VCECAPASMGELALTGTIVTFDPDRPVLDPGVVYLADGVIHAVSEPGDTPPSGFTTARRLEVDGVIYPGLIDLHSHLAYNTLPLWEAEGTPYLHHDIWPDERDPPAYSTSISWPSKVLGRAAAEALIKYVEVRALVGGTTAIQGAPHTTRAVDGWLVRIVDNERFVGGADRVLVSALQKAKEALRKDAVKLRAGHVLVYHMAEGQVGTIVKREFKDLSDTGCLQPGLIGVHAGALSAAEFEAWQDKVSDTAPDGKGTVVWSPFSNLWLYHETTDVVTARDKGLRIALGSDWAPSGTKHVLGELKLADLLNREAFDGAFSDAELCEMVTANPGAALAVALEHPLGRLERNAAADLVVMERHHQDVHRNLIEATERHVQLVVIRGQPFYGIPALVRAAGVTGADEITVDGRRRALVVKQPGRPDAALNWRGVRARLEEVRDDPIGAWREAEEALAAWGGALDDPDAPLVIFGDMPEGDLGLLGAADEPPADLVVPRLDSLTHDARFFAAIERAGPPELQGLADYYE
jgi:5-methylthioadenosine/S-adenosylhomocysteine deaminase